MKLSEWAKKQGIHYQTAWRWFKSNKIEGAYRSESGSVFVPDDDDVKKRLLAYQRLYEQSLENEERLKAQIKEYQRKYENPCV